MSKYRFILPLLFLVLFSQLMAQQSLIDKGLNAEKLGLPSRAEEYYRQSIVDDPENPMGYFLLGKLLQKKSHLDEAVEMFRQAFTIDEKYAEAYVSLV